MADNSNTIVGYNEVNTKELSTQIKNAYTSCVAGIVEILKTEVVDKIANNWYSPEACQFFGNKEGLAEGFDFDESNNLKEAVKKTSDDIHGYFDAFRLSIEAAYSTWYYNTGGSKVHHEANGYAWSEGEGNAIDLDKFDKVELELDVSSVKAEDDSGNVYINPDQVRSIANGLGDVENQIKNKMTEQKSQLNADTSFLGGGQAEAIETCFGKLLEKVSEIFKWLTTGEGNLAGTFEQVVQKYEKVAEDIADSYNHAYDTTSN